MFNNDHGHRSLKPRTGSGLILPVAGGHHGNKESEGAAAAAAVLG